MIELFGVHKGAPYRTIGLMSESNNVLNALNDNLDLFMVRFSPKNALIALVLRFSCAIESLPDE